MFGELPDALSRTVDIAARCNVKIERIPNPFPEFKVPDGHTAGSYFEKVVREGFATRVPYLEQHGQSWGCCAIHWRNTSAADRLKSR